MDRTSLPNTTCQLTCPDCGRISVETMPTHACVYGEFDNVRVKPPESVDGSLVVHIVDPSGVLLIFVQ